MRKIIVTEFISIDGVVGDPHHWHFPFWSDEMGNYKMTEVQTHDGLLLGRTTYEGFAEAWPNYEDEAGFADRMNSFPKYVVSTTLENPAWNNTTVISGNVVEELLKLKAADGQDIMIAGSVTLINSLLETGVIDEYRLMVHPIVVGKGLKLWSDREASVSLDLRSVEQLPNGVTVMNYIPRAAESETVEHPYADQGALND